MLVDPGPKPSIKPEPQLTNAEYPRLDYAWDPSVPGTRAGYLKAVWPDFLGCVFEVWPAPGAQENLQK